MAETPFKISIPDAQLAQLRSKLELASLPNEVDGAGWAYGVPLADVRRLVERWRTGYDWRTHEAALNAEMPQFTRDVAVRGFGELNVHYVHKRSACADAVPLLFVHGWPGSFLEVRKILPLLTEVSPDHPSFHVVALSLPGYGFSEPVLKPGFAGPQYAELGNNLMLALGYNEYVTQGGDWGNYVTRQIAIHYGGKHSKAWHSNYPIASPPTLYKNPLSYLGHVLLPYSEAEKAGLERSQWWKTTGFGYFAEQSTCPQTLGYSLADSPVGLLAWIYEKLHNWTDEYPWTDDEVLTWISIFWFSRGGPAASVRIYYEVTKARANGETQGGTFNIPMGISSFPRDLLVVPESWVRRENKLVFSSIHSSGGHFAAWERPAELVGDLRKMFGKGGPAFGVVPGKTGYST